MKLTIDDLRKDPALVSDFVDFFFDFRAFNYQKTFLEVCLNNTRVAGKWCRQSGKSQIVSIYTLMMAILEPITIIIVAPTQSQSGELFAKVRDAANKKPNIRALIRKSTETEMRFSNGSRIISLPCGPYGATIRGYTCDILIIEEAGLMKDEIVNTVLVPMLASKGDEGQIIKIGTPLIRNNFYRSCYEDPEYKVINVVWQDCVKEGQYTQKFIDEQKSQLLDIEFRTEYEAEFIDSAMSFFPVSILELCKCDYPLIRNI